VEYKKSPLVSVVIHCYNHEKYVQESIQSVIGQDYEKIELIIIDDGSKDSSVEKIQEMIVICKARFERFEFRSQPNQGLCATPNEALDWCEGEYFCPIASDDVMLPRKTKIQVDEFKKLSRSDVLGVFSGVRAIDERGHILSEKRGLNKTFTFEDVFLRKAYLPAPSAMLNLRAVKELGGYNSQLSIEGLDMCLKLTKSGGKLHSVQELLVAYRRHDDNFRKS